MNFNINQPTTPQALAQLYMGGGVSPDAVDNDLLSNAPRGYDYIHKRAAMMGIADPAAFFRSKLLAQKMESTPSGALMEANRLNGAYDPKSLPGQLQAREAMFDSVMANDRQRALELASVQKTNRLANNPIPEPGVNYGFSDLQVEDMRQQGITNPMQYVMEQRLGRKNLRSIDRSTLASLGTHGVDAEALMESPLFQNKLARNPEQAAEIYQALTGGDYLKSSTALATRKSKQIEGNTASLRRFLDAGEARPSKSGVEWSEMKFDPMAGQGGTGRMVPTGQYTEGNAYQRALGQYMQYIDPKIKEFQDLDRAGGAAAPAGPIDPRAAAVRAPIAPLQTLPRSGWMSDLNDAVVGNEPNNDPRAAAMATHPWMDAVGNFIRNQGEDFAGSYRRPWFEGAGGNNAPTGRAMRHARPILAQNPEFIERARRDPAWARQMLQAIQLGLEPEEDLSNLSGLPPANPLSY